MRILVTGGGGFLGQAICTQLRGRGLEVVSLSRGLYPPLAALGVRQVQGDLASFDAVLEAARGCQAVFHVGAKAGAWGGFDEYFDANVAGTAHVLAACRIHEITRLVYTSTPSVTHRRTQPVAGGNERDTPYGSGFLAWYPATKRIAEENVLAANDAGLATVALRPRLIWGPGDNQLLPRLVSRARAGRLRLVGDGLNRIDTTYIDNAVHAHLLAFDALQPGANCAGKAYFISNGEPRTVAEVVNALLRAAGAPTIDKTLPFRAAYWLGAALEVAWSLLPLGGEPPMTRFLAEQLSTTHFYDISAARRDFGYQPQVAFIEGLQRLGAALRAQAPASAQPTP
ncbi:MAG TPA: NAD-dependent epimerase/dehydratase family protein [Xanthomonadaceae bacterium]|nr:NAD-dependent epimerase/dehydratase family protein [Xanthomonadaceae bacterium]